MSCWKERDTGSVFVDGVLLLSTPSVRTESFPVDASSMFTASVSLESVCCSRPPTSGIFLFLLPDRLGLLASYFLSTVPFLVYSISQKEVSSLSKVP